MYANFFLKKWKIIYWELKGMIPYFTSFFYRFFIRLFQALSLTRDTDIAHLKTG